MIDFVDMSHYAEIKPISEIAPSPQLALSPLTVFFGEIKGSTLFAAIEEGLSGDDNILTPPDVWTVSMADALIGYVVNEGKQVVAQSDSSLFLARLQRRMAEEIIPVSQVRLYSFYEREGLPYILHLELDDYGNITNWPKDLFGDEMAERAAMIEAIIERRRRNGEG